MSVTIQVNGQPRAVEVRTGLSDGTSTEILEGPLKEGAEVILGIGEAAAAMRSGWRAAALIENWPLMQ